LTKGKFRAATNPTSGLPGGQAIEEAITRRVAADHPFAVGYLDIDHFKPFNDVFGFATADSVIRAAGATLRDVVQAIGAPDDFLGHIGGDDFVFICTPEQVLPLTKRTVTDFETAADQLYDPEDARRGYIEVPDRRGNKQRAALVTLSIGVAQATAEGRRFDDARVVVAVASEMKKVAKSQPGSYVAIDRRRADSEDPEDPSSGAGV